MLRNGLNKLRCIRLREDTSGQNLLMQLHALVLVWLSWLKRCAFPLFDKGFEDRLGVVGEVHHDHIGLVIVAAIEA